MIQEKSTFTIDADDKAVSSQFTLKQENLAHVFGILRNNLYSDKVLAVIREYSTNASDANTENGKASTPIEVTFPTMIDPVFKVRDFGKGLSENDIFEVYSSYGASTKRESNDYVGTLGMGSKSAFGYVDSFTITSYHGGLKKVYEAYIDETKIGAISKIHEEASSEQSGICVSVTVNTKDINQFRTTGVKFFQFYNPTPVFLGNDITQDILNAKSSMKIVFQSNGCLVYRDSTYRRNVGVKMGNIVYPVNNITGLDLDWLGASESIIINVNIGEVSFTTSRESLEMSANTIKTINHKIDKLRFEITKQHQKQIDDCEDMWSALHAYNNSFQKTTRSLLTKSFTWRKKKVNVNVLSGLTWMDFNQHNNQWRTSYTPPDRADVALIVDDGGYPTSQTRSRLMSARALLLAEKKWNRICYGKGTKEDSLDFLASPEIDGARVVTLSSVQSIPTQRAKGTIKKEKVFIWNRSEYFPYSSCWDSIDVDIDTDSDSVKLYVTLDSFKPVEYQFSGLRSIQNQLMKLGYADFKIYGVKKDAKLDSTWINLKEYINEVALEIVADDQFIKDHEYSVVSSQLRYNSLMSQVWRGVYNDEVEQIQCPITKKVLSQELKKKSEKYDSQMCLIGYADGNPTNSLLKPIQALIESLVADIEYIADNYPLIFDAFSYTMNKDKAKQHTKYINLMYLASLDLAALEFRAEMDSLTFPSLTI
jgi:hypothetical protein